jgi:hypothetical protein
MTLQAKKLDTLIKFNSVGSEDISYLSSLPASSFTPGDVLLLQRSHRR